MNFLAATLTGNCFSVDDSFHEVKPLAVWRAMRQPIDAGWAERTNSKACAQPVTVDKLLDGRLVRSVVARRSSGVVLVERPVFEDSFVDGACRDENKAVNTSLACRFDELKRAHNI